MSGRSKKLERDLIEWRRAQELQKFATGQSMTDIAEELKVSVATVSMDLKKMRTQAREKHGEYIENLPFEHTLSIASINKAHDELWKLFREEKNAKMKKAILDSIGDIVVKRQILLGDPQHIDRALRAVARIKRQLVDQLASEEDDQEVAAQEEQQE